MNTETIDTAMARRLLDALAIQGASIIGQPGGWSVMLQLGATQKPLGVQRSNKPRSDAAQRMRQTHQAAAYDKWFRAQVAQGLREADDPSTVWLDNSTVMAQSAERRAQWLERAKALDGQST